MNPPIGYRSGSPIYQDSTDGQVVIANLRYLGGEVRYLGLEDHLVSDVNVHVTQPGHSEDTVTGAEGDFEVSVNPDKITGIRADAEGFYVQEGVDLLDITKVGQHVALTTFSLAQEWVAADVNRDYAVDGLDIASMLPVALGEEKYFSMRPATNFFELIKGSFTWEEAKADAELREGRLAAIYSNSLNDQIAGMLSPGVSAWTGLHALPHAQHLVATIDAQAEMM